MKIYIEKLPKSCKYCPMNAYGIEKNYCSLYSINNIGQNIDCWNSKRHKKCPLVNIKIHDRELVKEVCEKIREYLRTQVIYCGGRATELDIMIASAGNQVLEDVKQFLDQIQKLEGEDE